MRKNKKWICFAAALVLSLSEMVSAVSAAPYALVADAQETMQNVQDFATDGLANDGMCALDLSEEAIAKSQITPEEMLAQNGMTQEKIDEADAEYLERYGITADADGLQPPVIVPETEQSTASADTSVSGNCVSGNSAADASVSDSDTQTEELSIDYASYATVEEAGAYLRDKMVLRKEVVSVRLPKAFLGSASAMTKCAKQILDAAVSYDEDGKSYEGDYLYYHLQYMSWAVQPSGSDGCVARFSIMYRTSYEEEQFVTKKITAIVKELQLKSASKSEYEKVRLIYDYIMDHVQYDTYHYNTNQSYNYMYTAYGALSDGYCVCQAYATLFYRLCHEAGISARVIAGNNTTHGWNIVRIGDYYYNVDVTWDDSDTPSHIFFLKNQADFWKHIRDKQFTTSAFEARFPTSPVSYRLPVDVTLMNVNNRSEKITLIDGTNYSLTANGKEKVILFLNAGKADAVTMLMALYDLDCVKKGEADVVIIDTYQKYDTANTTPEAVMQDIMELTDKPSLYKYAYSAPDTAEIRNRYAAACGKKSSDESCILVVDRADKIRHFGEGADGVAVIDEVMDMIHAQSSEKITGLSASQTKNNELVLKWNAYPGTSRYLVYRKTTTGSYFCVGSTTGTTYRNAIKGGECYVYKVYACNSAGDEIAYSDEFARKTKQILPKKGKTVKIGNQKYKVLSSATKQKTVAFVGTTDSKVVYLRIPDTIKIDGISYQVTEIASGALKGKKKLKSVSIGCNVTKIGSKAFYKDTKLVSIVIRSTKLKSVGKQTFLGISAKAVIEVPKVRLTKYKKLLKGKGQKSSVKIKK